MLNAVPAAAVSVEMSPPQPSIARSLRLSPGLPVIMVTVRFDDPATGEPAGLTVVMLKPELFRVAIDTSEAPPSGLARPDGLRQMNSSRRRRTAFLIILPSELPDKTVFACLVMGTRYRPIFVFAGAAAAFAVHVALAVTAGGLLSLLPHRPVQAIAAGLFLIGAVLLWRQHSQGGDERSRRSRARAAFFPVAGMAFAVVFAPSSATSPRSSRSAWRPGTATRSPSASVRRWRCG